MSNCKALELALARFGMIAPTRYAFTGVFARGFLCRRPGAAADCRARKAKQPGNRSDYNVVGGAQR